MTAPFVWIDSTGEGRNRFVLFRRLVTVRGALRSALLHLFVDNRYRLRVNGVVAGYGPVRFVTAHPEHDSIDLTPYLRPGENAILVEAWSPGSNNFQAMRESRGGMSAWGMVRSEIDQDLATPGAWTARVAAAWDAQAPAFSFAQGPVEICDGRNLPISWFLPGDTAADDGLWRPTVPIASPPWGPPTARSIPALPMTIDAPSRLCLASRLSADEECVIGRVDATTARKGTRERVRFPFAVCIHSPQAQEIELGTFWGPNYLNGVELAQSNDALLGNRQNARAALRAGWNLFYGEPETLGDIWGVLVAVPRSAGVSLRPGTDLAAAAGLRVAEPRAESLLLASRDAVPATPADLDRLPWTWTTISGAHMPARQVAWDRTGTVVARESVPGTLQLTGEDHVLVYDLAGEALGHPLIELSAPAGTVVDLAMDERLRADGQLALYASNPFTDTVDRLITDGTRRTWEAFHPRGGRYLQITLRPPAGSGGITVHAVGMRSAGAQVPMVGVFRCADPVLTWSWQVGQATLRACIEDAFLDCPWRERGTYLGDALVETNALRYASGDLSVAWRTATLAAQAQLADGQLQGCVPSWLTGPMGDFSLIWILMVRDLWALSGETDRVRALWPMLERVLRSARWRAGTDGLWYGEDPGLFVDWGAPGDVKTGDANAAVNALRIRAVQCLAELATALGRPDASGYHKEAEGLSERFRRHLWMPSANRFAASLGSVSPTHVGLHANVWALAFGIPTDAQATALLSTLEPLIRDNARITLETEHDEYLELYFLHYLLQALYRHDRADLAEQVMRSHALPQRSLGAWTFWESLRWGAKGQGSLCHAWSAAASWAAHERILGCRYERPGMPDHLVIAPDSHLAWAEGVVPHPRGPVRIAWRREGGILWLDCQLPPGVTGRCQPGPAFAGCRLHLSGTGMVAARA